MSNEENKLKKEENEKIEIKEINDSVNEKDKNY